MKFLSGRQSRLPLLALGALALCLARPACAQYTVTDLGVLDDLPGQGSYAFGGVNNAGQVAGYVTTSSIYVSHAFRWTNGVMTDLGTVGDFSYYSYAESINASGVVAGFDQNSAGYDEHAIFWDAAGVLNDLGTLPDGYGARAHGLNDAGKIVGESDTPIGRDAFLYDGATMNDLGVPTGYDTSAAYDINNADVIIGSAKGGGVEIAHTYSGGAWHSLGAPAGYTNSRVRHINSTGQIVGFAWTTDLTSRSACFYDGTWHNLGTLGGTDSAAEGINASGKVVGISLDGSGAKRAFYWNGATMIDLNTQVSGSGWTLMEAQGINDSGRITGWGVNPDGNFHAFLLSPVTAMATISGVVTLDGCLNMAGMTVTFVLRPVGGGSEVTRTATLAANGAFSLASVPVNNYTAHIKGVKWLAQNVAVNASSGDVGNVMATLPGGDADNNNLVDIGDFGILVNAYGGNSAVPGSGYDAAADFDCNGIDDIGDFGLLVNNYGSLGDP